jgi:UPF0716 family protein affecting phage T7 exclusion
MINGVNIVYMNTTTSKQQREAADGKYTQLFKNLVISALVAGGVALFAPGFIGALIGVIVFSILDQMDDERRESLKTQQSASAKAMI